MQCVVPENTHAPPPQPPTESDGKSKGRGDLKGGNFRGGGGLLKQFFLPGGLSKIAESFNK